MMRDAIKDFALVVVAAGVAAATLIVGLTDAPVVPPPAVSQTTAWLTVEQHAEGDKVLAAWKQEVARRFPNSVLYYCHGNDLNGSWYAFPMTGGRELVQHLADRLHEQYAGRIIVLVMCNPGGRAITTPGVYYAQGYVRGMPDKTGDISVRLYPNAVGNIFEFTGDPLR